MSLFFIFPFVSVTMAQEIEVTKPPLREDQTDSFSTTGFPLPQEILSSLQDQGELDDPKVLENLKKKAYEGDIVGGGMWHDSDGNATLVIFNIHGFDPKNSNGGFFISEWRKTSPTSEEASPIAALHTTSSLVVEGYYNSDSSECAKNEDVGKKICQQEAAAFLELALRIDLLLISPIC
jgi:hypothetical protein